MICLQELWGRCLILSGSVYQRPWVQSVRGVNNRKHFAKQAEAWPTQIVL